MKSIIVLFVFLNVILQMKCQFAIPEEYRDVKDAIESDYYKEALDHFFKDEDIPLVTRGGRIAGGETANIGQFPYHALLYMSDEKGRYVCGGVLVKYNWILTAAHCIEGFTQIEVFLGVINRIDGPAAWRSNPITDPKHLIVHPNFDARYLKNDIGLIFLQDAEEDLLLHEHIETLEIPSFDEGAQDLIGRESILSGFGLTEDGVASKVLKYAKLKIISNEECYATFPAYIVSTNLCTATSLRGSPCQGDSD
ncbi:brachyurin-like isoform X2 [Chironomus tepperi]|uniref:brachyurin-like isoform X2 n=1 Tax=Chironomus tepperi TaxID=113505 RepID=UPI00391EEE54